MTQFSFENKLAIVTGGARGIGAEIANTLLSEGTKVVIFDKDEHALNTMPDSFQKMLVDVTNQDAVQQTVEHVISVNHKIDILINNAGIIYNEPLINLTKIDRKHNYETYKKNMDVNLNSVFLMSSTVAEQMILKRTKGVIINVSSICSHGNIGQTAYSAAKAGVNAFTQTWAKELGAFGIRVLAISPGFMATESTKANLDSAMIDSLVKRIPLRRLGQADEVAHAILFAIKNQYMNGTILNLHGGLSL